MALTHKRRRRALAASLGFIPPQLATLVAQAPDGPAFLHELKLDGYRMAARLDKGDVRLLTRTGLDGTTKYPVIAEALAELPAKTAYLDGELCGVLPDGKTAFNIVQNAADNRNSGSLVFFLFDLLFLNGDDLRPLPLIERKERLKALLADAPSGLQFADHQFGCGPAFHGLACEHGLEGTIGCEPTKGVRIRPYSITSSARARSWGGIDKLRALAALRFTTNSKAVGCCMGRSAGLAPLRIFST
jgi:ATP-dependent DNA ligase